MSLDIGLTSRMLGGHAIPEPDVPDSGVGRWTYRDEDTENGMALDVWRDNDATIHGATTGVGGANQTYDTGEAYEFDGIDDWVESPMTELSGSFSAFGWFNLSATDANRRIICKDQTDDAGTFILFYRDLDNNIEFAVRDADASDFVRARFSNPAENTWYSVCGVYDDSDGSVELFVDGTSVDSVGTVGTLNTTTVPVVKGADSSGSGQFWAGRIDDPRIYAKVLSATEVSNLHNTGQIDG